MIRGLFRNLTRQLPRGLIRSAGFSVLDLKPLAWYDAADSNTITESVGLVSEWRDKSGNLNHAAQTVASSQPTYFSNRKNGLGGIEFKTDFMATINNFDFISNSKFEIFIVLSRNAQETRTNYYVASNTQADGGRYAFGNVYVSNITSEFAWGPNAAAPYDTYAPTSTGIPSFIEKEHYLLDVKFDSDGRTIRRNALELVASNDSYLAASINSKLCIGTQSSSSAGSIQDADFYEIIITPILSAANRSSITFYLAEKWGISI